MDNEKLREILEKMKEISKSDSAPVVDYRFGDIVIEQESVVDKYDAKKKLLAYYNYFKDIKIKDNTLAELFNTVSEYLRSDYRHLREYIEEDMDELEACYNAGAYKATLILAGSVLEAFLLDWLSEKHGKDYFNKPFLVMEPDSEGNFKRVRKDSLADYISQIREIERPDWMEESNKADYIREKRNLVHVKICLKSEVKINQETCNKVITYLKDIVAARLSKRKRELSI